jgi:hypothetical protein
VYVLFLAIVAFLLDCLKIMLIASKIAIGAKFTAVSYALTNANLYHLTYLTLVSYSLKYRIAKKQHHLACISGTWARRREEIEKTTFNCFVSLHMSIPCTY